MGHTIRHPIWLAPILALALSACGATGAAITTIPPAAQEDRNLRQVCGLIDRATCISLLAGQVTVPTIVSDRLAPGASYHPHAVGTPTGVVLLDEGDTEQNEAVCTAMFNTSTGSMPTLDQARKADPNGNFLITYWMLADDRPQDGSCFFLMEAYDYTRAAAIKAQYGLSQQDGPIILALDTSGQSMFFSLGDTAPQAVFSAVRNWKYFAINAAQGSLAGPPAAQPRPQGIAEGLSRAFALLLGQSGSQAQNTDASIPFSDPTTGTSSAFNLYRTGTFTIGSTLPLQPTT